jgi:hypothetical protein
MRSLEDVLQDAMMQAQREGCVLAIDYRPDDALPWWVGSVTVSEGNVTGVISETDGLSLQDVLSRWVADRALATHQVNGLRAYAN